MSLSDTIASLANASITIARTTRAPFLNGRRVAGVTTTIGPIAVVAQPAVDLSRVTGGASLAGTAENQRSTEIYQIHTTTRVHSGEATEGATQYEPDVVTFKGKQWTVARVEEWNLDGDVHYRAVITRQTRGGA